MNDPERARMRRTTHLLLSKLASVRTCVALSGRSRVDLKNKLAETGIHHLIGNHGAEPWEGAYRIRKEVPQWQRAIEGELPGLPGLWIENKALSLTIHYRECRQKAEARSAIVKAARLLPDVRLIGGKEAVSIVSQRAPHKGTALKAKLLRLKCVRAVYVGDDETDEDVFRLTDDGLSLFAIRIGRKTHSRAGYFLRNQEEIDELLRLLLRLTSIS
ncbi:MAG: trehalose-phosphatase [Acidobacteria bacterium]|nr:trehalose-phosphatase [Acidobacteriota bacterium]